MHSNNKFRLIAILALALAGMALVASQAVAHGGRGHHRGDRQARLDGDRDGASNRCEIQAGLDLSNTDSDGNGTIDGLEDSDGDGANNAAESRLRTNCSVANTRFKIGKAAVKSYSAEDGLVLAIGKRGLINATVSEKVVCEQDDSSTDTTASISRNGGDDEAGDDRGDRESEPGDDHGGDQPRGEDRPRHDDGNGDDENDTVACTAADLTEGADVLRAKVKNGVVTRIHLAAIDEGDF
jgi:hypothetical protein